MTNQGKPIYPTPEIIEAAANPTPLARQMAKHLEKPQTGLIHIYTGNGKGKTTASVGLTVRAHAHGLRVLFVQFLKNGLSGEIGILRQLDNVRVLSGQADMKFSNQMEEDDKIRTRQMHEEFFAAAVVAARAGEIDLLVLDETFGALATGLLDSDEVYNFLVTKPSALEVVLTGRDPDPRFLALADYISDVQCIAHPYEKGILAREGIDY
ncbi:MAG: cob(I)yrinic acid a,c-diamide adenosyltransferase [Clostridia bacterium]|nr:cob(I)yrinic acid a,c-diamide adenosyltransferase [Clostridia bacterium]NCC76131.1 cob(I)yrinic acid a,c-diamide adenosyltransferase [Clostridia bacterium]